MAYVEPIRVEFICINVSGSRQSYILTYSWLKKEGTCDRPRLLSNERDLISASVVPHCLALPWQWSVWWCSHRGASCHHPAQTDGRSAWGWWGGGPLRHAPSCSTERELQHVRRSFTSELPLHFPKFKAILPRPVFVQLHKQSEFPKFKAILPRPGFCSII